MARRDIHRPSAIRPEDYAFVAFNYLPAEGDILGNAIFLASERARLRAHMARTGGKYASHEHGGSCHICGAHAIYTAMFHHPKTNTYVRTGLECAEKLECGGIEAFRRTVHTALEATAGKRKAKAVLEKMGLAGAWEICEALNKRRADYRIACDEWNAINPEPEYRSTDRGYGMEAVGAPKLEASTDERTVEDIVDRLIKYGSISDKATAYLKVLVDRVERAPEIAAERAAEAAAAKPVPVTTGRMTIVGEVLMVRGEEGPYGPTTKMLVRHADGWKLWGTMPRGLGAVRGAVVEFAATVKVSDKDPKFGFWSRPAKARLVKAAATEAA